MFHVCFVDCILQSFSPSLQLPFQMTGMCVVYGTVDIVKKVICMKKYKLPCKGGGAALGG